jgi:large-conductance mechanosensitive channel
LFITRARAHRRTIKYHVKVNEYRRDLAFQRREVSSAFPYSFSPRSTATTTPRVITRDRTRRPGFAENRSLLVLLLSGEIRRNTRRLACETAYEIIKIVGAVKIAYILHTYSILPMKCNRRMFSFLFQINLIKSKDDKCLDKKINCKMSKKDIQDNQNSCNNCNCNCSTINFHKNIIFILIAFIVVLMLILFLGIKHVMEREQYLEMSKRQQEQLQTAQEELYVLKMQVRSFSILFILLLE